MVQQLYGNRKYDRAAMNFVANAPTVSAAAEFLVLSRCNRIWSMNSVIITQFYGSYRDN